MTNAEKLHDLLCDLETIPNSIDELATQLDMSIAEISQSIDELFQLLIKSHE